MAMEEIRMAKLSREEQARREGDAYAYKLVKEKGIEALEEDLRMRNIFNIPIRVSRNDLFKADERLTQFILLECLVTLRDYFGFGRKRALRFKECFEKKCQLIAEDWTSWADQAWIVATELGIEFPKDIQAEFEKRSGETR